MLHANFLGNIINPDIPDPVKSDANCVLVLQGQKKELRKVLLTPLDQGLIVFIHFTRLNQMMYVLELPTKELDIFYKMLKDRNARLKVFVRKKLAVFKFRYWATM